MHSVLVSALVCIRLSYVHAVVNLTIVSYCLIRIRCYYLLQILVLLSMQSGILAVGRGNKFVEPVTGSDGKILLTETVLFSVLCMFKVTHLSLPTCCSGVERPAVVTKMALTLSADHRVFDGKVGGTFC